MEITFLKMKLKLNGLLLCLSIGLFIVHECQGYEKNSAINSFLHKLTNCAGGGYLCEFGHDDLTYKFQPRCIYSFQRCNGVRECPLGDDERHCRCNELPSVKFGRFQLAIPGNDTMGALANVHCNSGYIVRGKKNIRCSTNTGKWEFWLGFCEPIKCGNVPKVNNGQFVLFDKGVIGDVAVLTCNKGYSSTSSQPTIIKCLPTGQWTVNNDKCVITVCDDMLPTTVGGKYEPIYGKNEVGSIAGLTCDIGNLGIVDHIRCDSDGTWKALADQKCDGLIGNIRLVGGVTAKTGRLELFINGIWGSVCEDGFDVNARRVTCRMLGFSKDNPMDLDDEVGHGLNVFWLDALVCDGSELSLLDCGHKPLLVNNCEDTETVALSCI